VWFVHEAQIFEEDLEVMIDSFWILHIGPAAASLLRTAVTGLARRQGEHA
jgi:hypothetical protein